MSEIWKIRQQEIVAACMSVHAVFFYLYPVYAPDPGQVSSVSFLDIMGIGIYIIVLSDFFRDGRLDEE